VGGVSEAAETLRLAYFGERPHAFLIDPQGLLGGKEGKDSLGFLDAHAGDCSIDLFVYVFTGDEEIPVGVSAGKIAERFFAGGRPAAIVYYFMGAPQRAVVLLSSTLTDRVGLPEQRRALESSVIQAMGKTEGPAQMEAFLAQLSMRLYGIERLLGGEGATGERTLEFGKKEKARDRTSATMEKLKPWIESARRLMLPGAMMIGVMLVGWALVIVVRWRTRYRLPIMPVEPRLGGEHAAGVGAVISFASPAVTPASQRNQVAEALRRD
jgi:hypothetical protein